MNDSLIAPWLLLIVLNLIISLIITYVYDIDLDFGTIFWIVIPAEGLAMIFAVPDLKFVIYGQLIFTVIGTIAAIIGYGIMLYHKDKWTVKYVDTIYRNKYFVYHGREYIDDYRTEEDALAGIATHIKRLEAEKEAARIRKEQEIAKAIESKRLAKQTNKTYTASEVLQRYDDMLDVNNIDKTLRK